MEIKLSENLKKIRLSKGITQEDLAKYLNIPEKTVSKWEQGDGYPGITLLPKIAAFYDVTVDELLGCDRIVKEKKINEYISLYNKNAGLGKIEDNIALMKAALLEFPNNLDFMTKLCLSLLYVGKEEYLDECIQIGEKILDVSTDYEQRFSVIQIIIYAYTNKKNLTKALEYAKKLPSIYSCQDVVLEGILKGGELLKLTQKNIGQYINLMDSSISWMLKSKVFAPGEAIFILETLDKLYNLFFYDKNYGYAHSSLYLVWIRLAKEYAKIKDGEKTLLSLKKAYYHAHSMDNLQSGKYTSLFFDSMEYSSSNSARKFTDYFYNAIKDDVFGFLMDNDEFINLTKKTV